MTELFKIADQAIIGMRDAGADKAACVVSQSEKREFNMEGGEFSLFRTLFNNGLNLTVIKDGKHGNVHANHLDDACVRETVSQVMSVAESGEKDEAWDMAEDAKSVDAVDGAPEGDMEAFFARVRELADDIARLYPRVLVEQMVASHTKSRVAYKNSLGVYHQMTRGKYDVELVYSGHDGDKAGSFFGSGVSTVSLDRPLIELGAISSELADAEKLIDTQPLSGKFEGVAVFPPNCLSSILSTLISNFTGARTMLDGTCIWKDKLGERVADERLTLSMNPRDPRIVCGERVTGEGFVSEDYDIIKDGVLKSFTLDLYTANKTGKPRAKNGSWSMVVAPGVEALEDIISKIDRGIVVGRFSGGEPGANGDFSGVAKNSFLIEHGRITTGLSETMINGNFAQMVMNLFALSRETVQDGSTVLPYAAFGGITISGK